MHTVLIFMNFKDNTNSKSSMIKIQVICSVGVKKM